MKKILKTVREEWFSILITVSFFLTSTQDTLEDRFLARLIGVLLIIHVIALFIKK